MIERNNIYLYTIIIYVTYKTFFNNKTMKSLYIILSSIFKTNLLIEKNFIKKYN